MHNRLCCNGATRTTSAGGRRRFMAAAAGLFAAGGAAPPTAAEREGFETKPTPDDAPRALHECNERFAAGNAVRAVVARGTVARGPVLQDAVRNDTLRVIAAHRGSADGMVEFLGGRPHSGQRWTPWQLLGIEPPATAAAVPSHSTGGA